MEDKYNLCLKLCTERPMSTVGRLVYVSNGLLGLGHKITAYEWMVTSDYEFTVLSELLKPAYLPFLFISNLLTVNGYA